MIMSLYHKNSSHVVFGVFKRSLLGVKICLSQAQIGLLQGLNSKFPTSIPVCVIWESPPRDSVVISLCSRHLKGKGKGFWAQEKREECMRKEGVISTFTRLMFIMQKTISRLYGRHFPPSFPHIFLAPRPTFPFL